MVFGGVNEKTAMLLRLKEVFLPVIWWRTQSEKCYQYVIVSNKAIKRRFDPSGPAMILHGNCNDY